MPHPLIGEFFGTMILVIFGNGVVANVLLTKSKGHDGGWMCVATGWFIAVVIGVFVAQSAGSVQGDINPAVTLTKTFLGMYSVSMMFKIMSVQVLGGVVGAVVVWLAYLPHWKLTEKPKTKLNVFATEPAIRNYPANFLCEVIGTFVLVIGVGAIFGKATAQGHLAIGVGPYLVGILVWGIGLSLGGPTGYAINPARDLGPRIAHAILPIPNKGTSDWAYAWVPVFGPLVGATLAALMWRLIF